MMKKRLGAILTVLILLLTAWGGAAEDAEKEPRLALNAVAWYPKESYPLNLMGRTEDIPYLITITNTGDAPCSLHTLVCQIGEHWSVDSFLNSVLEAGSSVTVLHYQQFSLDDLLPGTESEGALGTVEITFTAKGGENGEYVSNEVRMSHIISAVPIDGLPAADAELVRITLDVTGASVHPAGYQTGEKVSYQAQVINLSSQTLPAMQLQELNGTEDVSREIEQLGGLAPGEQRSIVFSHTVEEEDLARGYLYSAVSAAWTDPATQEALVSRSAPRVVMTLSSLASPQPAGDGIQLTASLEGAPGNGAFYVPGETARVSLRAVNASSSVLNQITLLDLSAGGAASPLAEIPFLLPGEEASAELNYTVTGLDALLGKASWMAVAKAADVYGNQETYVSDPITAPVGRAEDSETNPEADSIASVNTIRGLTLIQQETSMPARDGAYKAGETISYEIIVFHGENEGVYDVWICNSLSDGPDGHVGRAEQLQPGDFVRFPFEHTVSEEEEKAGCVVSWSFAEAERDGRFLGLCRAEAPVVSPAGSGEASSQGGFALPFEGDGCSLTLLARGANAAEYSQHYCARHAELYKAVKDLIAEAETEDELLTAWEQAAALWTGELNALYGEYLDAASGAARMAVMQERTACAVSLESWRALMDQVYAGSPSQGARATAEEIMRRCLELCGDGHSAHGKRADSLFQNGIGRIVSTSSPDACERMTMLTQDETVQYRDTLCAAHSTVEEAALTLLEKAADGQNASEAWFSALRACLNAQYEKGGEEIRYAAAVCALRLNSYLAAHAETLSLLYPDDPQTAREAAAQNVMRCVLALCREGLN